MINLALGSSVKDLRLPANDVSSQSEARFSSREEKKEEAKEKVCEMIYKAGDDLRQDVLVMQMFQLMLNVSHQPWI